MMSVEPSSDEESGVPMLRVHDCLTVKQGYEMHVSLYWTTYPVSDMVSSSIMALVLNTNRELPKVIVESEPSLNELESVKKTEKIVHALLVYLFGDVKYGENGKLVINIDVNVAYLDKQNGEVKSENEGLKEMVRTSFRMTKSAMKPIFLLSS